MYRWLPSMTSKQQLHMHNRFLSLRTLIHSSKTCTRSSIPAYLRPFLKEVSFPHPGHRRKPLFICRSFSAGFAADEGSIPSNNGPLKKRASKVRTYYVCENCGESFGQWWGWCSNCKMQGSLKRFSQRLTDEGGGAGLRAGEGIGVGFSQGQGEEPLAEDDGAHRRSWVKFGSVLGPQRLTDVLRGISECQWRMPLVGGTGMEVARVLGGGLVPGSLILLGGDPGVGKSTLLLQISSILAEGCKFYKPAPVLYVSGEESEEQISCRADRIQLATHDLFIYAATDLELILCAIQQLRPRAVVIDSIQTVYLPEAVGSAGSVVQVRECAAALLRLAKRTQIPIFLVGHVTRSGDIAGPRVLEHIVDVVLYLEGENGLAHRILRVVKNRFGSTDEVGVFEMVEDGLAVVENPSQLFLSQREEGASSPVSGAITVTMEGSRPFLVEIQALCSGTSSQSTIKHTVNGLDPQRLHMILAVISKLTAVKIQHQNVLISVVGGLQVREPAVDLAVAVAICSSYLDKQIPADMAFVGEIGLGGEIRPVRQLDRRIMEVSKLGFKKCVVPKIAEKSLRAGTSESVTLIHCATINEVIQKVVLGTFQDAIEVLVAHK